MGASVPSPVVSDYRDLVHEVRSQGLLEPRTRFYVGLASALLLALGLVVVALVLLQDTWWVLLVAPVAAVVSAQVALFSHDAAHRQVTRSTRGTRRVCLVAGNTLSGLSYGWWVAKHNAHHAHPNDLDSDPDVAVGAFVFDQEQARRRTGGAAWLTRHQAWLFFPMLTLEAANLHLSSVQAVLRPGLRHRRAEALTLLAHLVLYVGLLAATTTWEQALAFVAVHQALFGVYLGCTFAPSHKGMPPLTPEQADDPLLRQVLASRNLRGGPLVTAAYGGLNLQIEHHLFPSMPRPNLRRAVPLVRRHCEERGIPYTEVSPLGSYARALRHLRVVGEPLRAGPAHRA